MSVGRSAHAAGGRNAIVTAVAVAFLLLLVGIAQAAVPVGSDFRISKTGADGDTARVALDSAVAYNSKDNEYLVVWYADNKITGGEYEIYGRRINTATGSPIGSDFPISDVGPDTDPSFGAFTPAVAYDATDNQYLVVWYADDLGTDDEFEIFGQRLSAVGEEVGTNDFRISTTGPEGDASRDAFHPAVAWDSQANEFLVVWEGDKIAAGDFEIFGQRLSNSGVEVGADDFQISNMGAGDAQRDAEFPKVAYGSQADEYLVVWDGDGLGTGGSGNDHLEIFGQRITAATGAEVGTDDFKISTAGTATNTARFARHATVAYGSGPNEYVVAWEGNPLTQIGETEIMGQRISATGTVGGNDIRISNIGVDQDQSRDALLPAATYNPAAGEYTIVFEGDGLDSDNEFEIFGQRLSSAAAEVGSDFRISSVGPDGDPSRGAFAPGVAASTQADAGLVIWYGDGLETDNEFEIFAHRLGVPPPTPPTPTPVGPTGSSGPATQLRLTVRAARFQRALRTKVLVLRVTCNVRCAVTAAARMSVPRASKTYKLKSVSTTLAASKTTSVRVKLSRRVIRAAKRALKKRKRVTATVGVTARDASGTRRAVQRAIRIRR